MTVEKLRDACQGGEYVRLQLPGTGSGATRRLCGRRGPRHEIISVSRDGTGRLCRFLSAAVLRFLDRAEKGE